MLVLNDSRELGDKQLNPEEGLAKLKEENEKLTEKHRIAGQDELEQTERSFGPRLSYQEILRRLWKVNSQLQVREGSPGNLALYVRKNHKELEDVSECGFGIDPFFNEHKYVGGFPKQEMPEYSHLIVDERGLPKREYRGWRSVLISLIKAGVISYAGAVAEFGEASGQWSGRWFEQTAKYRK